MKNRVKYRAVFIPAAEKEPVEFIFFENTERFLGGIFKIILELG
jgi:hypothetical protein